MYDFDGVDDRIAATVTAVDSEDWTIAAWCHPDSAGESNIGTIVAVESVGVLFTQGVRFNTSARVLIVQQGRAVTFSASVTTNVLPITAPSCVVAAYRVSDELCRVWIGDADTPMVEAGYSSQSAGSGVRSPAGTVASIGNRTDTARTWDGRVGPVVFDAREWSLPEMERFRRTGVPLLRDTLRGWWPSSGHAWDVSGRGADGTVTGAVAANDVPLPGVPTVSRRLRSYVR